MKKVSVIVPVYNVEKYLEQCLNSILEQDYDNLELVLVNDGSTDDSLRICTKYAAKDSRVRLFSQYNQGISAARNTGINLAGGEYLTFVDSDDWLVEGFIHRIVDAHESTGSDITVTDFAHFDMEESMFIFYGKQEEYGVSVFTPEQWFAGIDEQKFRRVYPTAWGKLYNRNIFSTLRYPVGKIAEDDYTTYKSYLLADKITYLYEPLYIYRRLTPQGITVRHSFLDRYPLISYEESVCIFNVLHKDTSSFLKTYKDRVFLHGQEALHTGRYDEYRKEQFVKELIEKYNS